MNQKIKVSKRCLEPVNSDVRKNGRAAEKREVVAQFTLYFAVKKSGLKYTDYPINVVWGNYCCLS
jgi:hypothetical protein